MGGINLIDDRFDLHNGWSDAIRLDYAVEAHGPVSTPVLHTIKAMDPGASWQRLARRTVALMQDSGRMRRLQHLWQQARMRLTPSEQAPFAKAASNPHPTRCAFVLLRDNLRQRRTIERAAIQAIKQARREIDIVTPYFYPARQLRLALRHAAAQGVRVRLLLQARSTCRLRASRRGYCMTN